MYIYAILLLSWLLIKKKSLNNTIETDSTRFRYALKLAIPLILVMGLRHVSVGVDTIQYHYRYYNAGDLMNNVNIQYEIGYNLLNYLLCDLLHINFQIFLIITSALYCAVLAKFISKYSSNIALSFCLHLTIGMFTMSMSGIRQSIAVSLCILAFIISESENQKTYVKYAVAVTLNLIAYTIHNSCIIFLPFYFLGNIRLTKAKALIIIALGASSQLFKNIMVQYGGKFFPTKYDDMTMSENYQANILVYLIPILISFFCWVYSRTESDGRYNRLISKMFIFISLTVTFINLMGLNNQLGRMSCYFIYSYYVLIPYAFKSMESEMRRFLQPLVIAVCLAYFVIGSIGDVMHIDDYKFFWEDIHSSYSGY